MGTFKAYVMAANVKTVRNRRRGTKERIGLKKDGGKRKVRFAEEVVRDAKENWETSAANYVPVIVKSSSTSPSCINSESSGLVLFTVSA